MKHSIDHLPPGNPKIGNDVPDEKDTLKSSFSSAEVDSGTQTPLKKPRTGVIAPAHRKTSMEILAMKTAAALQKKADPAQQILQMGFPNWDEDRRGVPNPLIRGGLFTTRMSTKRMSLKSEQIASLSNSDILYTGEELRQDDLTVWMSIVNLGRDKPVGEPCIFTAYRMIKDMKWRMHVDSYTRLRACIERLKVTSVKITTKGHDSGYAGSLIRDFAFNNVDEAGNTRWMVRLEPAIANLFLFENTTLLEWEQRKQIGTRAALTLWLHTFYSSHREPLSYSVTKLHELCKSEEKKIANFRARLRNSMETLIAIGLLENYAITSDVVHVKRVRFVQRLNA